MTLPFAAIRQSKVSEDIVEQIQALIKDGKLKPGEKLPSERQLAQILEVGRSSLREAVNTLSMMGLVEVRQRKGIYVGTVSTPLITDPLRQLMESGPKTFTNLYDIRIDIEVASATAAAEHRSEEQLQIIAANLERMEKVDEVRRYATDDDLNFHLAIAEASDNFLRVHIIKEIFDLAHDHIDAALKKITAVQENIDTIYSQHSQIYLAIANKNLSEAGVAMRFHLEWVKSQLTTFLKED